VNPIIKPSLYRRHSKAINIAIAKYNEKTRLWHTFAHITQMLEGYNRMVDDGAIGYNDHDVLAILFHDFIYVPGMSDNEERSAMAASDLLKTDDTHFITKAIMSTKLHTGTGNHRIDTIIDLDMSIMGGSNDMYNLYSLAIRWEHRKISEVNWRKGRVAFLESILSMERIFATEYFSKKLDFRARSNIKRELTRFTQ